MIIALNKCLKEPIIGLWSMPLRQCRPVCMRLLSYNARNVFKLRFVIRHLTGVSQMCQLDKCKARGLPIVGG